MAIMQDKGASILAKLKNKARASNISFQHCLQLFFQEEFLRRLANSSYSQNFILKGGLFIYTLTNFKSRATIDIDFLVQYLSNEATLVDKIITEIISVPTGFNDIVIFEAGKTEPIALQMKYQGVRIQIIGHIKKVRLPFNIDIGIGDVVIPKPEKRIIKTQLEGFDAPKILTYSLESTIAEKFEAMLQRFELTSRMKDFYDIFYLAHTFNFKGKKIQEALTKTLNNRGTLLETGSLDRILRLTDDAAIQVRWRNFQKTMQIKEITLSEIMQTLTVFLRPICEAIISNSALNKNWKAELLRWE